MTTYEQIDDRIIVYLETEEDYKYIEEIKQELAYNLWEQRNDN